MWLLDNVGSTFQGRRLWLRPGKRYLFGRTKAEAGQLVISDKTISRKHLTIEVSCVTEGDGRNRDSRSVITIEDLNTKIGTVVNGTQIRGQKLVLSQDSNNVKMGHMADIFRITWHPIVLSFSFTTKELRADPWVHLRGQLEQLDIKYIAEYDIALTTHVVAKKRNTSKGLQALINGKYIVTETFISAVEAAAAVPRAGSDAAIGSSLLEEDFDGSWPNALEYLPPRGDEPSDRPISTYGPNELRKDIFDGYTFIFYDQKQYDNLFPPITNGKGKALLGEVIPGQTQVDDFIRYVKRIAGDQSLGEFEDGGEGQGVVVVRYLPAKGDHVEWFGRFSTAVSLRLDHRLIDQREFLDAILAVEPSMLRRSLQEDTGAPIVVSASAASVMTSSAMDVDHGDESTQRSADATAAMDTTASPVPMPIRRGRARRGLTSRFKGFDADLDLTNEPDAFSAVAAESAQASEEGMFMSQTSALADSEPGVGADDGRTQGTKSKKRAAAAVMEEDEDDMGDIAPTAAAVKRRRIAAGVDPLPPRQSPEEEEAGEGGAEDGDGNVVGATAGSGKDGKGKAKKVEENAILEQARKNREAAEKRAADEREQLAQIPDDGIDAEEIRRLTIVEEISVRAPTASRTRDQDVADGRWNPHWNGRRNFKKFRKQGDAVGRSIQRVIVGLEPVKTKDYGIGDDYWLEGENSSSWRQQDESGSGSGRRRAPQPQPSGGGFSTIEVDSTVASTASGTRGRRWNDPTAATVTATVTATAGSSIGFGSGERSGPVEFEVIPDTEPEDEAGPEHEHEHELESVADTATAPASTPEADLPRTRAGKAAQKTATRQSRVASTAAAAAAATRPNARAGRGRGKADAQTPVNTQSQLDLQIQTAQTAQTQTQSTTAARGKRTATGPASGSRAAPAKKTRRGAAVGDSDSDEDDGLQFKFRSRR